MSASMAEALAEHRFLYGQRYGVERVEHCSCGWQTDSGTRAWEANGYGKLEDAWDKGAYAYETRRARDESLPLTNPYRTKEN